jgi:hypothetical protein
MLNPSLALDVADPTEHICARHAVGQHDRFTGRQAGREANHGALLQHDNRLGVLVHRGQVLS